MDKYLLDLFIEMEIIMIFIFINYQDEQGFRIVIILFWRDYFIYQYDQLEDDHNELLSMIKSVLNDSKFH